MNVNLNDKIVLISGGAGKKGSIGETLVWKVAKEGGIPVIVDRNPRGYSYESELLEKGHDCLFIQTDLTDPTACREAVEAVEEKYGRLDVLVNNVGVNDGVGLEASYEDFIESLHLNLVNYFLLAKHSLKLLKASKGNILNISSKVALTGQGGTSGYAASKGAVLALTREWAVDLSKFGIRVNSLVISESWTPAYKDWLSTFPDPSGEKEKIDALVPLGNRMTTPEEIANTVLFLISELSSHTTGQQIVVDGGYIHLDRRMSVTEPTKSTRSIFSES
ncbi:MULTISPECIES: SDR family oxidoreductase [Cyclobacteriaceae]|jgi:L-fucose dehydrogenase|uniref:Oxidoreductase n=2 Tax=Cyclobacteriaceae TaxID=563798 RepID=S2D0D0_INDAL|nr:MULTISPECIES: SDR family oxidoreductase [Cyclobacteriaceae]EOZ92827.1 Putative oxidoreductase [Indibacter alkaliphilus LW1]MBW3468376.1 SDR family oxidoreductase [Arthrospiribacter ruber]